MSQTTNILGKLLAPVTDAFTPDMARRLAGLTTDSDTLSRITLLREKANEGDLSDEERKEYATYVEAINLVGILQAKARALLARSGDAP